MLAINRDDRRLAATVVSEKRAETLLDTEREPGAAGVDAYIERPEQLEQLYIDVLYMVANTVGAPDPNGQVCVCVYVVCSCCVFVAGRWRHWMLDELGEIDAHTMDECQLYAST